MVQDVPITVNISEKEDYICITDIAKAKIGKSKSDDVIKNWLRNRGTLEFLGTWENIYNPNFKPVEFDGFRSEAVLHTFSLSVSEWVEKTNAMGLYVKRGKYGGTYAHIIKEGKIKEERFDILSSIANYQLNVLNSSDEVKLIK